MWNPSTGCRPSHSIGRQKQTNTQIPTASPQQQVWPGQHEEQEVFKQQLQHRPTIQPPRCSGQRPIGKQDDHGDNKTSNETDNIRAEMTLRKYERIENVPNTSPDADWRWNDNELGEETITDECTDLRMLNTTPVTGSKNYHMLLLEIRQQIMWPVNCFKKQCYLINNSWLSGCHISHDCIILHRFCYNILRWSEFCIAKPKMIAIYNMRKMKIIKITIK